MKIWVGVSASLLIVSGAACLAVSANGSWGVDLYGRLCWVFPLYRLIALIVGIAAFGWLLYRLLARRSQNGHRCPRCRTERLAEWTICHGCGEVLESTHKEITKL